MASHVAVARRVVVRLAVIIAVLLAWTTSTRANLPVTVRHGNVVVHAEAGLQSTAERLAARADEQLARVAEDLPDLPAPRDVEIRLVNDSAELANVAPEGRGVPPWAIGVAFPGTSIVAVALHRGGNPADAEATMNHELAHLALDAALGQHAPHWLHEGFAYQHSAEWSWERTETLAGLAWLGNVIPLDDLDRSFPAEELPATRAYAESYDFVGFLAHRGRWEDHGDQGDRWPFRRFLAGLSQGLDIDKAAVNAFGRPLRGLFGEWSQDLHQRYLLMPAGVFTGLIWFIACVLLVLGYLRRRRQNRHRIAMWDELERREAAARNAEAAARAAALERIMGTPDDAPIAPIADPDDALN